MKSCEDQIAAALEVAVRDPNAQLRIGFSNGALVMRASWLEQLVVAARSNPGSFDGDELASIVSVEIVLGPTCSSCGVPEEAPHAAGCRLAAHRIRPQVEARCGRCGSCFHASPDCPTPARPLEVL